MAKKKIERLLETFGPQLVAAEEEEKRALIEQRRQLLEHIAELEARAAGELPELEREAENLARQHEAAVSVARAAGLKAWEAHFRFTFARSQNTDAIEAAKRSLEATAPEIGQALWAIGLQIERARERFNISLSKQDENGQSYYGEAGLRAFARSNAREIDARLAELRTAKSQLENLALTVADILPATVENIMRKASLDKDLLNMLDENAA
jgi:hypothetical protein